MKKTFMIALIVLAFAGQTMLATAGEAAPPSKQALKLMKKAQKAIEAKEFDKATEFYQQVIEMEAEYAEARFALGRLQLAQNQLEPGEDNLKKALELDPGHTEAAKLMARLLFSKGQQFQQQRNVEEANQCFRQLIDLPNIAELDRTHLGQSLYQLGVNLYTRKNFAESTEYLKKFQQLPMAQTEFAPIFPASNYIIGLNYSQQKDYEASNEYLSTYIDARQDAENDQLLPLAHFVIASNNFQVMEAEAEPIRKDKEAKDLKEKLAAVAAKFQDAIVPHLEKAIELKVDLEPAYLTLGNFYYYKNDRQKTVETYEKMISLFPDSPDKARYEKFLDDVKKEIAALEKTSK
ncbi:MAG TPA: tetratricopeptide repeat protein [Candidatus Aminicenantes bacterium]|nr:tetratricopeptide repeat protein [Candidatus Aminicenantes bacterium]